jgi:hypothetical protein
MEKITRGARLQSGSGKVGWDEAIFGLEPGIAEAAGPYHSIHLLLDPVVVLLMRRFGYFERFDVVVVLHFQDLDNPLSLDFTARMSSAPRSFIFQRTHIHT